MPAMLAGMDTSAAAVAPPVFSFPQPSARLINLIVVHCSATVSGQALRRGSPGQPGYLDCAHIIDGWHAERGFGRNLGARAAFNPTLGSIGYHFVIDVDGQVFTGRHVDEIPAQAAGFNAHAIGICMIGGAEPVGRFTPAQWKSLADVMLWQAHLQRVPLMLPVRNGDLVAGGVCGHRDLSPDLNHDNNITPGEWLKTCPGFDVRAWLLNSLMPLEQHIYTG